MSEGIDIKKELEIVDAATQDEAQWNTKAPASDDWKRNAENNAAFIRWFNPQHIRTILNAYEELQKDRSLLIGFLWNTHEAKLKLHESLEKAQSDLSESVEVLKYYALIHSSVDHIVSGKPATEFLSRMEGKDAD